MPPTVSGTVTDSNGNTAPWSASWSVADPSPGTKIGMSFGANYPVPAGVTSVACTRYFFQQGDWNSAQTWNQQSTLVNAYQQYGCRSFSVSMKPDSGSGTPFSSGSLTRLRGFFNTVPSDVELLVTFYHEHDGNIKDGSLTVARYVQGCNQLADVVHEYPSSRFKFGPIHNGMVYDPTKTPKWGLWANIWAANEAPVDKCDFIGFDCYSPEYENPSPRMNAMATYAQGLGKPLLIGELASPYDGTSSSSQQAVWAAKARTWALANTKWANWWHSRVSATEPDFHMSDASAAAWFGL